MFRFVVLCLIAPPLIALTVLIAMVDRRVAAVSPEDVEAILTNARWSAERIGRASGNAERATANLARATLEINALLESAGDTIRQASGTVAAVNSETLPRLNRTVDALDQTADSLHRVLTHVDERVLPAAVPLLENAGKMATQATQLTAQLSQAAPGILDPLTDCESNPSCFENRWRGLTFDLEQTMRAVKEAAPEVSRSAVTISDHAGSIAASVDRFTEEHLKPRSKKQLVFSNVVRFGTIALRAWLLL